MTDTSGTTEALPRSSARFILNAARSRKAVGANSEDAELRLTLIGDLFIKARSFMILNKIAFYLSLFFTAMVIAWPALGEVVTGGIAATVLNSAIVQTSITGLAALFFALYGHYKKRQVVAENLMRRAHYTQEPVADLSRAVIEQMERLDLGFTFGPQSKRAGEAEARDGT